MATPGDGILLCNACRLQLMDDAPQCRRCAAPVPVVSPAGDCPLCRRGKLHFDGAVALGVYRGELRLAMLRIKHWTETPLAIQLGKLTGGKAASVFAGRAFDLAAPMPMHWQRRAIRGCNPAESLAESAASRLGIPLAPSLLHFRRTTEKQNILPPSRRFSNVRRALGASLNYDLQNAQVLLVDDTMTTGATASEAARALKQAGAAGVYVAVVSRGIGWR
ncbi:DNA utilization protein GntX [Lignipirellula cremea]|uniref:DNA utilization protein GntX n=2 Tax=Lignipirellula cremea TaxID=2528010 RepID=A0A518DUA0_9BACT|nr:DNA utilization protein GntX [Lignipirellula cremea]